MRYWEFLIQQEGDQTWLPLETRQVEILEGRYRMAAHTSYDSTSVEIRVNQLLLDEIPPRRRVRKRKADTNDSGLLAIFPFIQLSPGRWEIDCNSPNVIDDFLGEGGWHYSVQLQVTPRDEDDWEPNWSENSIEDGQSQSIDTPNLEDQATTDGLATDSSLSPTIDTFQLQLKQQAYVAQLGHPLNLVGHLSQGSRSSLSKGKLWVELRDPQTASTIKEMAFDIPNQPLRSPFSVTITLPDELSTQVILGAISLVDGDKAPNKTVLASASFTITMGLAQMLDAIANQPDLEFEEEISIFPGSTEAFVTPPEKSETLLTSTNPILPKEIIPSEGLTLPPQIKPLNNVELDSDRQPELPTFSTKSDSLKAKSEDENPSSAPAADQHRETISAPKAEEDTEINASDLSPADLSPAESNPSKPAPKVQNLQSDESESDDTPLPFAEPRVFKLSHIEDDDLDLELATAALQEDTPQEGSSILEDTEQDSYDSPATPQWNPATVNIDRAFQKLQLRERFWQKLNLLTQDGYRHSLEVKQALQPSDTQPSEGNLQSNEFVVYEPPKRSQLSNKRRPQATEEPIQMLPPTLEVPNQELVAGEWIAIKVRVPADSHQPYVKVWMNDLQTRTM
ncbi:MAG: hypothetical protein AAGF93_04170, partial [Cyanobacteria bacterium P01_H01_bin.105]